MITLALEWWQEYDALRTRAVAMAKKLDQPVYESEVWEVGDLAIRIRLTKCLSRLEPRFTYWKGEWFVNGRRIGYNHLRGKLRDLHKDPKP